MAAHVDELTRDDMLSPLHPGKTLQALAERETAFDFDRVDASSKSEIRRVFADSMFFGCEADDPMTKVAYDEQMLRTKLRPVLGSDLSHWDVTNMSRVLEEAYELVEHGLLDPGQFREFVFENPIRAHAVRNPDMFAGTIIEAAVTTERDRIQQGGAP